MPIFKPSSKNRLAVYILAQFERGKTLKVEPVRLSKTVSQNAYLWLIFTFLAEETGGDKTSMYYYYLNKFPKYKEIEVFNEIHLVQVTLGDFSKEQTMQFINEIVSDALSEGFEVPDPEDFKAKQMLNYYQEKGII